MGYMDLILEKNQKWNLKILKKSEQKFSVDNNEIY
jgi:hypothetical protein